MPPDPSRGSSLGARFNTPCRPCITSCLGHSHMFVLIQTFPSLCRKCLVGTGKNCYDLPLAIVRPMKGYKRIPQVIYPLTPRWLREILGARSMPPGFHVAIFSFCNLGQHRMRNRSTLLPIQCCTRATTKTRNFFHH